MKSKNRIGIYCNPKATPAFDVISKIKTEIAKHGGTVVFHKLLVEKLPETLIDLESTTTFDLTPNALEQIDVLLSIGGDGTFLGTVPLVINSSIPVIGINTGRLGFLATVSEMQISSAIHDWFSGKYSILERSLIEVNSPNNTLLPENKSALNDITIRRTESANMMSFNVFIDGQFLNNYWADGLILSTPTGSTAYSLSCGGPILDPKTAAFILTPIASHNLTVRPLVVSDSSEITIAIAGRTDHYSLSIDSESYTIAIEEQLTIKKAPQTIKTVVFDDISFYDSIRDKLSWGIDLRNE